MPLVKLPSLEGSRLEKLPAEVKSTSEEFEALVASSVRQSRVFITPAVAARSSGALAARTRPHHSWIAISLLPSALHNTG